MNPGDRVRLTDATRARFSYTVAKHRERGVVLGFTRRKNVKIKWDGIKTVENWWSEYVEQVPAGTEER